MHQWGQTREKLSLHSTRQGQDGRAPEEQRPHPGTSCATPGPRQPGLEKDRTPWQSAGGVERPLHRKSAKILRLQEMRA